MRWDGPMTKTVFITDIREIKTIKVSCTKCGLAIELPLSNRAFIDVTMCRNCRVEFPMKTV